MFGFKKKKEPTLKELCDAVAAHPDSVIVAVFDHNDFEREELDPSTILHDELSADIYHLVMNHAERGYGV